MSRRLLLVAVALSWVAVGSAAAQGVDRPRGTTVIDVNRPLSPFECDTPIAMNWYGSRPRCLQDLCAGRNVYNEYIFDEASRRRRNPCYRQNPTQVDFP